MPSELLDTQRRIDLALRGNEIGVLGSAASPYQYFTDIMVMSQLIRLSWPLPEDLIPYSPITAVLGDYLEAERRTVESSTHKNTTIERNLFLLARTPPTDITACASLIAIADKLLTASSSEVLTAGVRHLLSYSARRVGREPWTRAFRHSLPDSSEGMRRAVAPILQPQVRHRHARGLDVPIRRMQFGSKHVAQFLEQSWFDTFLAHLPGISEVRIRRAVAVHLVQIAEGGTVDRAVAQLGLPDTPQSVVRCTSSIKVVRLWALRQADPEVYTRAVMALADHIDCSSNPINYAQRRGSLHGWQISPPEWDALVADVRTPGNARIGDLKRIAGSIFVWQKVTGTEHFFAPGYGMAETRETYGMRRRLYLASIYRRIQQPRESNFYGTLNEILTEFAETLARRIDAA
ncbi:hypothetical protein [Actinoplanes teichomyceticus]|nr:hypothetical protein [Actinoplanes teichomyceticus]